MVFINLYAMVPAVEDNLNHISIGVIGLGYVGIPLLLALAKGFPGAIGFDINSEKVRQLQQGIDPTEEGLEDQIRQSSARYSDDIGDLAACNFFVIGVPTPVDVDKRPDLSPLESASRLVGTILKVGDIVVYESTVYPGVTEDVCGVILEKTSGLRCGVDFTLGSSPERINPGDTRYTVERIVKVVSGQDAETLRTVAAVYSRVITAGVHEASSIRVAEAAKVIENTQRDLNVALMNELAILFDRMHIPTRDVLEAAGTKWNFLPFVPGLVGGHCIGVDPYYLTTKAQQLGYHPQVILAGRRINDSMGVYIAQRAVKLLINQGIQPHGARIGILGLTFKENVSDVRNSRVPDICNELTEFGVEWMIHDPLAHHAHVKEEFGFGLTPLEAFHDLDALIVAVTHREYREMGCEALGAMVRPEGLLVDIKWLWPRGQAPKHCAYWAL